MSRYRPVAYTSQVDENLFGELRSKSSRGSNAPTSRRRNESSQIINAGAAVISADELYRIKHDSIIRSESEVMAAKQRALEEREIKEKMSKDRKAKMRDLEKRSSSMAKKSDSEIREAARKEAVKKMASEAIDNNSDVVKMMNSMAQRAIAFTIREKQLEEKERLEENEKHFDKKMDVLIEIDRLKAIQSKEAEVAEKQKKRLEDRKIINSQIAERERKRLLELESRELENHQMRELMQQYKREEEETAKERAIQVEKSKKAVLLANADAIRRKTEAKERAKKDMEDIILYNLQMDAKIAAREEEEAKIAQAKKDQQMKLLAQQERQQNNMDKQDELRARRAAEEKDRQLRKKEKEENLKRKEDMKELMEARNKQASDKLARKKLEKKMEEEEILNNQLYIKRMDDRETREAAIKREKTDIFRDQLQQQIIDCKHRRANNPIMAEPNIREELIKEEARLNVIRNEMVGKLAAQGVDDKYLSELKNVNIGKLLKR